MKLEFTQEALFFMMVKVANYKIKDITDLTIMNNILNKLDTFVTKYQEWHNELLDKHDERRKEWKLTDKELVAKRKEEEKKLALKKVKIELTEWEMDLILKYLNEDIMDNWVNWVDDVRHTIDILKILN